jgi:hypothetical protein
VICSAPHYRSHQQRESEMTIYFITLVGFYLLPTCIVQAWQTDNRNQITVASLLTGWTVIGTLVFIFVAVSDYQTKISNPSSGRASL